MYLICLGSNTIGQKELGGLFLVGDVEFSMLFWDEALLLFWAVKISNFVLAMASKGSSIL